MQDDFMTLLDQELRRHGTQAVRGSGDEYACHFRTSSTRAIHPGLRCEEHDRLAICL